MRVGLQWAAVETPLRRTCSGEDGVPDAPSEARHRLVETARAQPFSHSTRQTRARAGHADPGSASDARRTCSASTQKVEVAHTVARDCVDQFETFVLCAVPRMC